MSQIVRIVCMLLLLCATHLNALASHLYGGELYYTRLSGRLYKVTMILYGDCGGTASVFAGLYTATPRVQVYNGSTLYKTIDLKYCPEPGLRSHRCALLHYLLQPAMAEPYPVLENLCTKILSR